MKAIFALLTLCFSLSSFASISCSDLIKIDPVVLHKIIQQEQDFAKDLSRDLISTANKLASWAISDLDEDILRLEADSLITKRSVDLLSKRVDCAKEMLDKKTAENN